MRLALSTAHSTLRILERSRCANLLVLDRDIATCPTDDIRRMLVEGTHIHGVLVYERGAREGAAHSQNANMALHHVIINGQEVDMPVKINTSRIADSTEKRFGERIEPDPETPGLDAIAAMLEHSASRKWVERPVDPNLLRLLCAAALSAPSKSDMPQTDIIHVVDLDIRQSIVNTIEGMGWIMNAPEFLMFCGNNRRLRLISQWRKRPFVNDHFDQFFNAACDPAIILGQFLCAAEATGLGCCPISHVRNRADEVARILGLPDWVFPFAGLCVGYPEQRSRITPRLPLEVTVHTDRYDESRLPRLIDEYDQRRQLCQPYDTQREVDRFGQADFYSWSEDKARQYSVSEREGFGKFVREKGFCLD